MEEVTSDIVSSEQLAKKLGFTRYTILKYTRSGKIPAIRFGKRYRYSISEVMALFKSGFLEANG